MQGRQEKRYKINEDFGLVCVTQGTQSGTKYILRVIVLNLPFEDPLEEIESFDKDTANKYFKYLIEKYKGKKLFWT